MIPMVGLALAYLMGSIPAAYLAGRVIRGIDLREHGSGNLGATNVMRVMGPRVGLAVLVFDAAKGALPVLLFPWLFGVQQSAWWAIGYGVAAILGHVRPVFLLGKGGGKGVATAAGVFAALAILPLLVAMLAFIAVVLAFGYVSLGSLVSAAVFPLAVIVASGGLTPVAIAGLGMAAFVFWTHRANIGRLRRGEEHRFGRRRTGTVA
ncbi:MAG TPA: glycerol-3-phosphate 1-O-acyltransferase PlsY [Gemmatimonadaceae bacterium]|nr:glycerol-3-phosphate 1-O-acyltransferase PlsY [Gemmatimonadaceae bacterium]